MAATFLLVPRGFSAGEIDIQSDHMSWNTTKGTYQLNLLARIPINNPNFLNVRCTPTMLCSMVLLVESCSAMLANRIACPPEHIAQQDFSGSAHRVTEDSVSHGAVPCM